MKKGRFLNADIMEVISKMGHMDEIVIGDAGLPIPDGVRRIDLAIVPGTPEFILVLRELLQVYACEGYVLAEEILENNLEIRKQIQELLPEAEERYVPHEEFKAAMKHAKAVIRTGECTPYANIILRSGVIF
jgi:D-ribose pyranase